MSFAELPDGTKVKTFDRTEGADQVKQQAVVPVDYATGDPLDIATQATLAAVLSAVQALNVSAAAIQSAAEAINGKAVAINTGAVAGTVALDAGSLAALETISVANFPATQQVSGTVDTGLTQPLTDAQLRATAIAVSGTMTLDAGSLAALETINVGNFPATQQVSGTVTANTGLTQPLTDAQLRATPVPVTIAQLLAAIFATGGAATIGDTGIPALVKRRDADTSTVSDGQYMTLNCDEEGRVKVASKPASYAATTGNVTSATSTVFINTERFSNLMIHCTGTFSTVNCTFEGSLNSTNGTDGNWFTVQAIRSSANTIETTTGNLSAAPAYAWELSVNALKYFRVRATAWTSGTQVWTMVPGTYATEPIPGAQISGTQPVSGTVTANQGTLTAPTASNVNSAASTNATVVKASAGTLYNVTVSNTGAAARYVKFYNKATAPTVGTDTPVFTIQVAAGATLSIPFGTTGHRFATGIGLAITANAADSDTTAVSAGEVKVASSYI